MLISVADRFSFGERELWELKLSRLRFWYGAAKELFEQERDSGKTDD